jgi:hypothetical protein
MVARSRRVRLLASGLLATVLMVVSTAVATLSPVPSGGAGGPVLGSATSGPSATAVRSDTRVTALRGGHGSGELDLPASHGQPRRSPDSVAGQAVATPASGPRRTGDARRYQGRAPPRTR